MQHPIIRERVVEIFGSNFTVKKAFSSDKYEIMHGGKTCLDFEFMDDDPTDDNQMPFIKLENRTKPRILKVSMLSKCNGVERKGDSLLKLIDQLAASIPFVEYITLMDRAHVMICGVDINLAHLKILTTGQSWYNHFGYSSVVHHDNVRHNAGIINGTVDDALENAKRRVDFERSIEIPRAKFFPELSSTMPVREYVQSVLNSVRHFPESICTEEQRQKAFFLKSLIYYLSDDLNYNWNLIKIVGRELKSSPKASPKASPNASPNASPKASPKASPNASPKASPKSGGTKHNKHNKHNKRTKRNKCTKKIGSKTP
jgi:hypothetical protein